MKRQNQSTGNLRSHGKFEFASPDLCKLCEARGKCEFYFNNIEPTYNIEIIIWHCAENQRPLVRSSAGRNASSLGTQFGSKSRPTSASFKH